MREVEGDHAFVASHHPALAGHFPGNPIVPAVLVLARVLRCLEQTWGPSGRGIEFSTVKFLAPLRPDEPFAVEFDIGVRHDGLSFRVLRGTTRVVSGTLRCLSRPASNDAP